MIKRRYRKQLCAGILAFIMTLTTVGTLPTVAQAEGNKAPLDITELYEESDEIDVVDADSVNLDVEPLVSSIYSVNENAKAYDPRPLGRVTSVKDQGKYGLCWDYAANAAVESALIYQGLEKNTVDLSEIYFAYATYKNQNSTKKFTDFCDYGNNAHSFNTKVNDEYIGKFALESDFPMPTDISNSYSLKDSELDNYKYKVSRIYKIDDYTPTEDCIKEVKKLITRFGGATWSYAQAVQYQKGAKNANTDTNYYCPEKYATNHAVEVVGWNDNYAASNFRNTPPGNGAWLVKNSWGVNTAYDIDTIDGNPYNITCFTTGTGYMWISYYNDCYGDWVNAMEVVPKDTDIFERRTVDYNINDTINLDDLSSDDVAVWRKKLDSDRTMLMNTRNIIALDYGTSVYYAYDNYNNIIGVYTVNVKAKDNADYELTINKDSSVKSITDRDDNSGADVRIDIEAIASTGEIYKSIKYDTTLDGIDVASQVSSSNENVISVKNGCLKVNGQGNATITASYSDDMITSGKTYTKKYVISVNEICSSIKWEDGEYYKYIDVESGDTYQITGVTTVPSDTSIMYKSYDEDVVTISDTGLVTTVGEGLGVVDVIPQDNDKYVIKLFVNVTAHYEEPVIEEDNTDSVDTTEAYVPEEYQNDNYQTEDYKAVDYFTDYDANNAIDYNYSDSYNYTYSNIAPINDNNMVNSSAKSVKKASIYTLKNNKKGKVHVKFGAANADSYELQIAANKKFTKGVDTYSTKKTHYTIKELQKGKTYYVRVRGVCKNSVGAWSKAKKVKIKK